MCNERFEKTDKDVDYVLESETETSEEECRELIAPQAKLVSIMLSMAVHCSFVFVFSKFFFTMH